MQRVDGTAYMRQRMIASWVATNQLTELHLRNMEKGEILEGVDEGDSEMGRQRWGWSLTSEPAEMPFQYRIRVDVWLDSDAERSIISSMVTYLHDFSALREEAGYRP